MLIFTGQKDYIVPCENPSFR